MALESTHTPEVNTSNVHGSKERPAGSLSAICEPDEWEPRRLTAELASTG
jgi:hypothetical protein